MCCSLAVLSVPSTNTVAVMPFAAELGLDELLALARLTAGVAKLAPGGVKGIPRCSCARCSTKCCQMRRLGGPRRAFSTSVFDLVHMAHTCAYAPTILFSSGRDDFSLSESFCKTAATALIRIVESCLGCIWAGYLVDHHDAMQPIAVRRFVWTTASKPARALTKERGKWNYDIRL